MEFKINIPEPCHENWDKMTPNENGRFCLSCSKTVIDFTSMLPEEVQHFFIQNQNICGRFKNSQLDTITIQIPSQALYSQTNYYKMFVLALFLAMGTTLFSCQDTNGNKQKIDKVEVVDNTPAPRVTMGIPAVPTVEQNNTPSSIYSIVYPSGDLDVLPVPKNGMKKFNTFFNKNYTALNIKEKINTKISVLFVVEKDGSLTNFNIVDGDSTGYGEEIIKILEKSPEWIPGKYKNRKVRSSYLFEIPL